jgi:hypothetical protein
MSHHLAHYDGHPFLMCHTCSSRVRLVWQIYVSGVDFAWRPTRLSMLPEQVLWHRWYDDRFYTLDTHVFQRWMFAVGRCTTAFIIEGHGFSARTSVWRYTDTFKQVFRTWGTVPLLPSSRMLHLYALSLSVAKERCHRLGASSSSCYQSSNLPPILWKRNNATGIEWHTRCH